MTDSASLPRSNGAWTDQELSASRARDIADKLKRGWKFAQGLLSKAGVKARPSEVMGIFPGDPRYNPRIHAPAVRMGATFLRPNRYDLHGLLLDANGMCMNPEECPGCGTEPGGPDYHLRVLTESSNPFAPRWVKAVTYCRVCTMPTEIAQLKR